MQGNNTAGQVKIGHVVKAGSPHHTFQGFLIGMHADRLSQITVTFRILHHQLPDFRQHVERVGVIGFT
ncbi:hypothetical protein D3C80_1696800 [compost metagenome]